MKLLLPLSCLLTCSLCLGVIRLDLSTFNSVNGTLLPSEADVDAFYQSLAASQPEFNAVGRFANGSGLLVAPNMVLAAAHLGSTFTTAFTLGNTGYVVNQYIPHPNYNSTNHNFDLALYQLAIPVTGVTPVTPSATINPIGMQATFVSHGRSGNGTTGTTQVTIPKRAGTNIIETTTSSLGWEYYYNQYFPQPPFPDDSVRNTTWYVADFDDGTVDHNVMAYPFQVGSQFFAFNSSAEPTSTENGFALFDSGGAAFVEVNGSFVPVAVVTANVGFAANPDQYGSLLMSTRLSDPETVAWLTQYGVIPEAHASAWMLSLILLARRSRKN